jgi:hypothetical protein
MVKDNKIESDIYFAIVPEWVLDAPITAQAVRLYAVLKRYADKTDGTCYPSHKTIAKRMAVSVSTVKRAMEELVSIKAVLIEPRYNKATGEQTSNLYTVINVPSFIYDAPSFTDEQAGSSGMSYKPKSYNQSKYAEQYSALVEAFYKPSTKAEISGFNKCAKELAQAGATYDDITARVTAYRTNWAKIACTPYAIIKHWTSLGLMLEQVQTKEPYNCEVSGHKYMDLGVIFYCMYCKNEIDKKSKEAKTIKI